MSEKKDNPMSDQEAALLLDALAPVEPAADVRSRIHQKLMTRVKANDAASDSPLQTVAADDGEWLETSPGNLVKILRSDDESMSMLVRLGPGCTFPAHSHPADEETYVLEGETWFGDIHLVAGDYHLAPKGTEHGEVRTDSGCVLLIRKAAE